jgi:hypothetical protein
MSHYWHIACKCGSCSERFNHGAQMLVEAVNKAAPMIAAAKLIENTQWYVTWSWMDMYSGVAEFIKEHAACGHFRVVSEYASVPPIEVLIENASNSDRVHGGSFTETREKSTPISDRIDHPE